MAGCSRRLAAIVDLDKEFARIERDVREFGEIDLVIVDTSAAVFPGDDENSNPQMRRHAKRLRRFTELPGKPCTLALCHPVKNASAQESLLPRGGGAFVAEVDGMGS
jgi:RecA-family ATPase